MAARYLVGPDDPDLVDLLRVKVWRSLRSSRNSKEYEAAIAGTIRVRGQTRLPEHAALKITGCNATPRDIYVNF